MADAPPKQPVVLTVRAKRNGMSVDVDTGRHFYRDQYAIFKVHESNFVADWMEKVSDNPAAVPKPPVQLQTTLPAHLQPRPVH